MGSMRWLRSAVVCKSELVGHCFKAELTANICVDSQPSLYESIYENSHTHPS